MKSLPRIRANQMNALKSTGPRTLEGKERSRINAVRHGLTAETVIGSLEDAEDYQAFEEAITADYEAETAVERELVLRLASVLWRLRRATAIETVLFAIPTEEILNGRPADVSDSEPGPRNDERANVVALAPAPSISNSQKQSPCVSPDGFVSSAGNVARAFLRLAELPTSPLDRLSRYEHTLWRQARQIALTLEMIRHGRQHKRFRFSSSLGSAPRPITNDRLYNSADSEAMPTAIPK